MNRTLIVFLQSLGITLQMVNLTIAVITPHVWAQIIVGAVVTGYMFFVSHIGNEAPPPELLAILTPQQRQHLGYDAQPQSVVPRDEQPAQPAAKAAKSGW